MQLWNQRRLAGHDGMPDEPVQGRCCSLDDVYDARRVAETLGIPYYVVNQEERFERDVVRPFVAGVSLRAHADSVQPVQQPSEVRSVADHGAPDRRRAARHRPLRARMSSTSAAAAGVLKRPADRAKDQTYFLFGLTQEQLSRTLFPLGEMTQARGARARRARRPAAGREAGLAGDLLRPRRRLQDVSRRLSRRAGRSAARHRRRAGHNRRAKWSATHSGIHNFTVGQRKGLGVATGSPLYVLEIRGDKRQVVVGSGDELVLDARCAAKRLNWIAVDELREPMRVQAKIRHRHEPAVPWSRNSRRGRGAA